MAQNDADGITVTTATRSEGEVRDSLGVPAPDPVVAETPPPEAAHELEADSPKPDAEVSEAARTLRRNRADTRKAKIQDEINTAVRERETLHRENDQLRRDRDALKRPAGEPAAEAPAAPAAPKFEFPTYEQYLVDHADAPYEDYTDARTDARYQFNDTVRQEKEQRTNFERVHQEATAQLRAHATTFKADHADYDEVLKRVTLIPSQATADLQQLIFRVGAEGPGILYYLGQHPEDATRLMTSENPQDLMMGFGEVRYAAKHATPTADATAGPRLVTTPPTPPQKPKTDAPAPLDPVRGSALSTRSLQSLADDGEDADEYITRRRREMKAG